eukprot:3260720-Rhodomonas_salina.2
MDVRAMRWSQCTDARLKFEQGPRSSCHGWDQTGRCKGIDARAEMKVGGGYPRGESAAAATRRRKAQPLLPGLQPPQCESPARARARTRA